MAQEERMQGISLNDVIDYVNGKSPAQLAAEVDDFIGDMKNICKAVDTLYEEKIVPLSLCGFAVSIRIIDQESNDEEYFVHEIGKSASGKSLMRYILEVMGADE